MAIKIISNRTYSSKKLINGSLKVKTQDKAPMKSNTAPTRSSSVRFSLENNTVLNVPAIADYRYIELHRMFYRPKDYARFQLEAEREQQAPPRKTITKSCLRPRRTTSTTKSVRFDMQNVTVREVPALKSYTFVELYRLFYRSKDYDSFLRDAEQEETNSKTMEIRPVSSPTKLIKKGASSKKMAHKIRSSASSLQSVIISAASA